MLTYDMSQRAGKPLYEHLYRCIAEDIRAGRIGAGEKLPSKRQLAKHLGISLITVENAFSQLIAEGYVEARPRQGYYACTLSPTVLGQTAPVATGWGQPYAADPSPVKDRPYNVSQSQLVADLRGGMPQGVFSYDTWARCLREALSRESEQELTGQQSVLGTWRLRTVLARYLEEFRGMEVDPNQVVIGAGAQYLYGMIIQLLGRSLHVALENPGYPRLERIYQVNQVRTSHVSMDDQGICMAELYKSGANAVHLTPSHQFPTGIVTSMTRRSELLDWAAGDPARVIIEDDYDCEFRLAGRPIPPLQTLDGRGQVIYTNTFSKTLGAAFRIGYMVLPPHLAKRYVDELGFYSCTVSAVDQLALARFIEGGAYERQVNRMRTHCKDLRNALLHALHDSDLGPRISVRSQDSGLHFLLGLQAEKTAADLASRALAAGVAIEPLQDFCASGEPLMPTADDRVWFVVSYAGLIPEKAGEVAAILSQVWGSDEDGTPIAPPR